MNGKIKATIAGMALCGALFFLFYGLFSTSGELQVSLDVKSLAHTRSEENQAFTVTRRPATERLEPGIDTGAGRAAASAQLSYTVEDAARPGVISAVALLKETLGMNEPEPSVRSIDVFFMPPSNCESRGVVMAPVAVQYRIESPTIKGTSLRELEILMSAYRQCEGGEFHLAHHPLGKEDATPLLKQMRLDELKYFFLQHRVPKTALRFPDES